MKPQTSSAHGVATGRRARRPPPVSVLLDPIAGLLLLALPAVTTATPATEIGDPRITDHVFPVLRDHQAELVQCYETRLVAAPDLQGRVELEWSIEDGHVTTAKIVGDTSGDQALGTCLLDALEQWTFPDELRETVRFPLIFKKPRAASDPAKDTG